MITKRTEREQEDNESNNKAAIRTWTTIGTSKEAPENKLGTPETVIGHEQDDVNQNELVESKRL